jgi:nitric oxide dioxygenase
VPEDGGQLAAFKPGQYVTVNAGSLGTPTAPRNYSLSDRPGTGYFRITVKRETGPRGVPDGVISNYLHDRINVSDVLELGPPCGEFTLDAARAGGRPIVLLSGGVGLTPLASMLNSLAHSRYEAPVYFIHAARNSRFHALGDEVRRVAATCENVQAHFCYDEPLADDLVAGRCDSIGVVDLALLERLLPGPDCEFYICGPKPFMASLVRMLSDWGVPEDRRHYEFFGPQEDLSGAALGSTGRWHRARRAALA